MTGWIKTKWIGAERTELDADASTDPAFPRGRDINLRPGAVSTCSARLSYPASGPGHWEVTCGYCKQTTIVTTTGRRDDPRSVRLPCFGRGR